MPTVRLARRAAKDLDALAKRDATKVVKTLDKLGKNPRTPSLDVKALVGRRPWRRLRVGDYRVLYRIDGDDLLVARVVDRKDLDRAVQSLSS